MSRDGVARVLRRGRPGRCVCALLLAVLVTACGKKGPPLAPLRLIPEAPSDVSMRRVGNKAILNFTLPKKNANGPGAVDLDRVEIYAITAGPGALVPPNRDLLTRSYLVGTIAVKPPPVEDQPPDPKASDDKRPSPGDAVTFSEDLNEDTMRPAPLKMAPPPKTSQPAAAGAQRPAVGAGQPAPDVPQAPAATQAPVAQTPPPAAGDQTPSTVAAAQVAAPVPAYPVRVYILRGMTRRGRAGAPGPRMQLPLVPLPSPPVDVVTMFTEHAVALAWTPPVTDNIDGFASALPVVPAAVALPGAAAAAEGPVPLPGALLPVPALPETVPAITAPAPVPPLPAAAPASGAVAAPPVQAPGAAAQPAAQPAAGTIAYAFNVYEAPGDVPLNKAPLSTGSFQHEGAAFGKEQCFTVRTISTTANVGIEGEPSTPVCLTPRDIFPPAPPRGLNAVAGPGAISLIWEANTEADLAGYVVLRAEAPGGTLQPLTAAPIRETNYRDATVTAGVRYLYVVVAVDTATPPNASAPTARVEETAR